MTEPTIEQVRQVAQAICRLQERTSCVMDDEPERKPCTDKNCRMMKIARKAIKDAAA